MIARDSPPLLRAEGFKSWHLNEVQVHTPIQEAGLVKSN